MKVIHGYVSIPVWTHIEAGCPERLSLGDFGSWFSVEKENTLRVHPPFCGREDVGLLILEVAVSVEPLSYKVKPLKAYRLELDEGQEAEDFLESPLYAFVPTSLDYLSPSNQYHFATNPAVPFDFWLSFNISHKVPVTQGWFNRDVFMFAESHSSLMDFIRVNSEFGVNKMLHVNIEGYATKQKLLVCDVRLYEEEHKVDLKQIEPSVSARDCLLSLQRAGDLK